MNLLEKNIKTTRDNISILITDVENPKLCIIEVHGGIEGSKWDVVEASKDLVNFSIKNEILYISVDLSNNGTQVDQPINQVLFSKRVDDLSLVIDFVLKEYKCPIMLIGTSLGGLVAINATSKYSSGIVGLVINCGVVFPEDLLKRLVGVDSFKLWQTNGALNAFDVELPYLFFEDIQKLSIPPKIKMLNIPILWFHGEEDDLVPIDQIIKLSSDNELIKLVKIKNGTHRFGKSMQPGEWEKQVENFIQRILNS